MMADLDSLLTRLEKQIEKLEARNEKLDARISSLEKYMWMLIGGLTFVGATFGYILKNLGALLK